MDNTSILSGIIAGSIVGILSWIIHLLTNTPPYIRISNVICKDDRDGCYRIKIKNMSLSNCKISSAKFVLSYNPKPSVQGTRNDILLEGKDDPLLFGRLSTISHGKRGLRTFDTFVLDASRIKEETIINKTSERIIKKYTDKKQKLTLEDFLNDDNDAIISAIFEVCNYRTGKSRTFYRAFSKDKIEIDCHFKSGRSLKPDNNRDTNPKSTDK